MQSSNKKKAKRVLRYIAAGVLSFGLVHATDVAKAQGPPPPPPPPGELFKKAGNGLKKINPFKKRKTVRRSSRSGLPAPGTPPPAPGSPLNLKRPGTPPPPPKPPGL